MDRVVNSLIAAERANIGLPFERAAAIDLAGRNVLEAVQMSVNPKVIETPVISAMAINGIEVRVRARVTVRANIDRLVGGPVRKPLLPGLARVLLLPSAPVKAIRRCWRTRIRFPIRF